MTDQAETTTLAFVNRTSETTHEMVVTKTSAFHLSCWYGAYYAGDDYDVLVDGVIVEKDHNGEITV